MNEEKLIEAVRDFPCLWQVSSRCYRDAKAKENAWKKVSSQVNILYISYQVYKLLQVYKYDMYVGIDYHHQFIMCR